MRHLYYFKSISHEITLDEIYVSGLYIFLPPQEGCTYGILCRRLLDNEDPVHLPEGVLRYSDLTVRLAILSVAFALPSLAMAYVHSKLALNSLPGMEDDSKPIHMISSTIRQQNKPYLVASGKGGYCCNYSFEDIVREKRTIYLDRFSVGYTFHLYKGDEAVHLDSSCLNKYPFSISGTNSSCCLAKLHNVSFPTVTDDQDLVHAHFDELRLRNMLSTCDFDSCRIDLSYYHHIRYAYDQKRGLFREKIQRDLEKEEYSEHMREHLLLHPELEHQLLRLESAGFIPDQQFILNELDCKKISPFHEGVLSSC